MAGAGYKLFNTGDVLTAAQVNTYLQEQTVMVFANSTARTTALSGVLAEGMMSYLQDTNAVEVYNGSAWVAVGGGGLSSPLTTKGDVWGYSTTNARIPVGSNGTVLTADSAETLGVKWAAVAAPSYAFTTYTPTWGGLTLGNGTSTGAYAVIDQTVYGYAKLIWGSTTSGTGNFRAITPNNMHANMDGHDVGKIVCVDVGVGRFPGGAVASGSTDLYLVPFNASGTYLTEGNVSATVPFTFVTNDVIYVWYIYRKA